MKMTAMEIFTGTEDATIAKREERKRLVRCALIMLVIAILGTAPGWLPGAVYGGWDSPGLASRMAVDYAAQRLASGEIPLWNPNVALGAPVIGDGQTGVFFPTILLHMLLPVKWAWVADGILRLWLAGFGMVVLFRQRVGFAVRTASHSEPYQGVLSAVFAGVMYMGGALFTGHFQHSAINSMALVPWVVVASGALLKRISVARLVGMTLLLLLIFLGGSTSVAIGVIVLCLLFLIWEIARQPSHWTTDVGAIFVLAAATLVSGAVAAVHWMPARYNAKISGINGFSFRDGSASIMNFLLVAPFVALLLSMLVGLAAARLKRRMLIVLLAGIPLGLCVVGSLSTAFGLLPSPQLREAVKWIAAENQAMPVRFYTGGDGSRAVAGNVLAPAVTIPYRTLNFIVEMGRESDWIHEDQLSDHPTIRLMGVKYLIEERIGSATQPTTQPATAPIAATAPTRRLFGRQPAAPMGKMEWKAVWPTTQPGGKVVVYENVDQPLPRFWIARSAQWSDKAQDVIDRLKKSEDHLDFDPHETVLLDREGEAESEYGLLRRPPAAVGRGNLQLLEDSPERVRIGTQGAGGWLVLADAYAPGWTAKMSYTAISRGPRRSSRERTYERELAIVPAYGAMRAVALAGGAEIVFEYEPRGWKNGLMVAGIGGIVLLLMIGGMMFPSREADAL
jgi:hypothetical protein